MSDEPFFIRNGRAAAIRSLCSASHSLLSPSCRTLAAGGLFCTNLSVYLSHTIITRFRAQLLFSIVRFLPLVDAAQRLAKGERLQLAGKFSMRSSSSLALPSV